MKETVLIIGSITLFALIAFAAGCNSGGTDSAPGGKAIASAPAGNNLTATISNAAGSLKHGKQEFMLTFTDQTGKPVDVGSVALNYRMAAMGSMSEMNSGTTFKTTGTPGVYAGTVDIEMAGDWQAQITYEGPAGKGAFSIPVAAR